jgi:hypothetical protein
MWPLSVVCVLIGAQGVVGLVQYHNALPAELVWIHASLPALLWACLIWSWQAAGPVSVATPAVSSQSSGQRPVRA